MARSTPVDLSRSIGSRRSGSSSFFGLSLPNRSYVEVPNMRPMRRMPVNKARSARSFRRKVGRTQPRNMRAMPMRGGFRM